MDKYERIKTLIDDFIKYCEFDGVRHDRLSAVEEACIKCFIYFLERKGFLKI